MIERWVERQLYSPNPQPYNRGSLMRLNIGDVCLENLEKLLKLKEEE